MQSPAGASLEAILQLHDYISFFLVIIFTFVTWLFFNILLDFALITNTYNVSVIGKQETSYKFSSRIVHLGLLEVIWTIIPVFLLTLIAVPSFELLYALDTISKPLISVKCIGNQWFWSYEALAEIKAPEKNIASTNSTNLNEDNDPVKLHKLISEQPPLEIIEENFWDFVCYKIAYEFTDTPVMTWAVRVYEAGELHTIPYYPFSLKPFIARMPAEYDIIWSRIPDLAKEFVEKARNNPELNAYRPELLDVWLKEFLEGKVEEVEPLQMSLIPFPSSAFKMDSYMVDTDEIALGGLRLLETDVFPQLPADCELRFIITSMDVLHSFAVPSLGIKVDAIPGRLNQFGIKVRVPGIYFGQCSELCGVGHGFMPIKLQFVHYSNN